MKVLITGATGRIGRELVLMKPDGYDIEALVEPTEQHVPDYTWIRSDITDRERVVMAVTCAEPDAVIHLAAMTDVDGCERNPDTANRVNRDGAKNIAEACVKCNAKLIYISTDYVFDGRRGPYDEDDEPNPVSAYGLSKLEGEKTVISSCGNHLILRISVPFGVRREGANHNFVSWLVEKLGTGESVRIVDDQFTTPAYIPELSEMIWHFIGNDTRGILHYGTADRLSRYEMALQICDVMGFDSGLVEPVKTAGLGLLATRPLESGFITDRLHDIIGRPPILYRNALYRMMEEEEE